MRPASSSLFIFLTLAGAGFLAGSGLAAETATEEVIEDVSIGSFSGAYLAARTADSDRDLNAAIAFYSKALQFEPDNVELQRNLMIARFAYGEFEDGLKHVASAKGNPAMELIAAFAEATDALRGRQFTKVDQALDLEQLSDFDNLLAGLLKGWARVGDGKPDTALTLVEELEGPEWFGLFTAYHLALMHGAAGQESKAIAVLQPMVDDPQTVATAPEVYLKAAMALAIFHARQDEPDAAMEVLDREGLPVAPTYSPFQALRQAIAEGRKPAVPVTTANEGAAEVFYSLASALNRGGAELFVQIYLQFAHVLDEKNGAALVLLSEIAEDAGRGEEAIEYLRKVPEDSLFHRMAELQLGLNLADLDRRDEAKSHLKALITEDPTDVSAHLAYGNVFSSDEDYRGMAAAYDSAVQLLGETEPSHWNVYYQRGIAYERLKQWKKAEPNFLKALELYPDQPQVLNYLGYSWVDMNMRLEEGLDMIRKAVELRPNDGYIVDSLGWAYYRLGRYEEAVEELERAVELRPADTTINDHLGDAYWRLGRHLEAVFQWNHARDLKPEAGALLLIEAKIENGLPELDKTETAGVSSDPTGVVLPATPKLPTVPPEMPAGEEPEGTDPAAPADDPSRS